MAEKLYWRVEWHAGDVLAVQKSTGWTSDQPTVAEGLSACESAEGLLSYWEPWIQSYEHVEQQQASMPDFVPGLDDAVREHLARGHRVPTDDARVVVLLGEQIGRCLDGYPLIRASRVLAETTYGRLRSFPLPWTLDWEENEEVIQAMLDATNEQVLEWWQEETDAS